MISPESLEALLARVAAALIQASKTGHAEVTLEMRDAHCILTMAEEWAEWIGPS